MTPAAMQTPSTGLSAPPTMPNQGAPMVPPQQQQQQQHMQPGNNNMRNNTGYPGQQYNQFMPQQQQQQQQHGRPPYAGQGGYGPNSPMMIKKEGGYFPSSSNTNSPLMGGHSPGPGRPVQQQPPCSSASTTIPGAKSSPIPMSQSSPLTPQQQFNARKAPTPTNNRITPPPSNNVQFSQTQQQQMQMNMNGQQIQVNLFIPLSRYCMVCCSWCIITVNEPSRSVREPEASTGAGCVAPFAMLPLISLYIKFTGFIHLIYSGKKREMVIISSGKREKKRVRGLVSLSFGIFV